MESILSGACKGELYPNRIGNALLCSYKRAKVAYDPENLRGTTRTLDGAGESVPLEPGLASRAGWALAAEANPAPAGQNLM